MQLQGSSRFPCKNASRKNNGEETSGQFSYSKTMDEARVTCCTDMSGGVGQRNPIITSPARSTLLAPLSSGDYIQQSLRITP